MNMTQTINQVCAKNSNHHITPEKQKIIKLFSVVQDIKSQKEIKSKTNLQLSQEIANRVEIPYLQIAEIYKDQIKKMGDRMKNLISQYPEYTENDFAVHFINELINNPKDDDAYLHLIAYLQPIRRNIIEQFLGKYAVIIPKFT